MTDPPTPPDPEDDSDQALLAAWRAGDAKAGQELVGRHYDAIYGFYRAKLTEDITDLVHETFVTCIEKRDEYKALRNARFKTWLFGIARIKLLEYLRRKRNSSRRRSSTPVDEMSCVDWGGSPSTVLRGKENDELLRRALPRIPLEKQLLLELYRWEGFTARELGEIFDMPESKVRSRLRTAMKRLVEVIEELGRGQPKLVGVTLQSISDWVVDMQELRDERYPQLRKESGADSEPKEDEEDEGEGEEEDVGGEPDPGATPVPA